jgi:hypothetical protein
MMEDTMTNSGGNLHGRWRAGSFLPDTDAVKLDRVNT